MEDILHFNVVPAPLHGFSRAWRCFPLRNHAALQRVSFQAAYASSRAPRWCGRLGCGALPAGRRRRPRHLDRRRGASAGARCGAPSVVHSTFRLRPSPSDAWWAVPQETAQALPLLHTPHVLCSVAALPRDLSYITRDLFFEHVVRLTLGEDCQNL